MPRATLPHVLSNTRTFSVLITQHTEDEVYEKAIKTFSSVSASFEKLHTDLCKYIRSWTEENPYMNFDWKKYYPRPPNRLNTPMAYYRNPEEDMRHVEKVYGYVRDLQACDLAFKWSETRTEFGSILYDADKMSITLKADIDEAKDVEAIAYRLAKAKFEKEEASFIAEWKAKDIHNSTHHPLSWYIEKAEQDDGFKQFYLARGGFPDHVKQGCPYCIPEKKTYICSACCLETTCKTNYEEHLETIKHKKKTGQIPDKEMFVCSACNYETAVKQNWEKHCATSKHLKKIGQETSSQ